MALGKRFALLPRFSGRLVLGKKVPFIFRNAVGGHLEGKYLEQQLPFVGLSHFELFRNALVSCDVKFRYHFLTRHYATLLGSCTGRAARRSSPEKSPLRLRHRSALRLRNQVRPRTSRPQLFGRMSQTHLLHERRLRLLALLRSSPNSPTCDSASMNHTFFLSAFSASKNCDVLLDCKFKKVEVFLF